MSELKINRSCTDVFCCFLFIAALGFYIFVSIQGVSEGNLENLAETFDSNNKPCGRNERLDYPYLYVNDFNFNKKDNKMLCVKSCPKDNTTAITDCYEAANIKCSDLTPYKSFEIAERICLPDVTKNADYVKFHVYINIVQQYYIDIKNSFHVILLCLLFAIIIAFIYYYLLKYFAGCFVYLMLIGFFFGLLALAYLSYNRYLILKTEEDIAAGAEQLFTMEDFENMMPKEAKTYKIMTITFLALSFLYLIFLCISFKSIKKTIKVIKIASKFINDVRSVVIFPFFTIIVYIIITAAFIILFGYLYSVGEIKPSDFFFIGTIVRTKFYVICIYFVIFFYFWVMAFFNQLNNFLILHLSIEWYINNNKSDLAYISNALSAGLFYHIGSIVFGSLLLGIVWFIQFIISIITFDKNKELNQFQKIIATIFAYIISCFERFIKFINKQAYCEVILSGASFCSAAITSFGVIVSNVITYATLNFFIDFFNFIASLVISIAVCAIGYAIMDYQDKAENELVDFLPQLIVILILSFFICSLFNSVYDNSANGIMYCVLKGGFKNSNIELANISKKLIKGRGNQYDKLSED